MLCISVEKLFVAPFLFLGNKQNLCIIHSAVGQFSLPAASQTGAVVPGIRSIVAVTLLIHFPFLSTGARVQKKSHGSVSLLMRKSSYLVMFSGLDGLERTDPVLHLFPVLGTKDEPTERSDHLEGEKAETRVRTDAAPGTGGTFPEPSRSRLG